MHSDPTKRGRQVAERNNARRVTQLIECLKLRGLELTNDQRGEILFWMAAAFHRGVDYGKRLSRREL